MTKQRNNSTGFKGVFLRKKTGRYESHFTVVAGSKHVKVHVGTYKTANEAHINRLVAIDRLK